MKPYSLDGMMASRSAAMQAEGALAATQPNPSEKEIQRQHILIAELFRRLDTLALAIAEQKAPVVNVEAGTAPQVTVEAARIEIPAPIVNVSQPDFKMDSAVVNVAAPVVNVAAPNVTVNPPKVNVSSPSVSVAAPSVSVAAPNVSVNPNISIPYPKRLTFKHYYDSDDNVIETVVTAEE